MYILNAFSSVFSVFAQDMDFLKFDRAYPLIPFKFFLKFKVNEGFLDETL